MSWFHFDEAADEAICSAEACPEKAAEVLRIAATYMRDGRSLPENLASYLVDAIDASMGKSPIDRGGALLQELSLKALNRRPADWENIGEFVFWDMAIEKCSQNVAARNVSVRLDISEPTAHRSLRKFKKRIVGSCRAMSDEEILESSRERVPQLQADIERAERTIRETERSLELLRKDLADAQAYIQG